MTSSSTDQKKPHVNDTMALVHPRSKHQILPLPFALFFTAIATAVLLYTHNSGPIVIQMKRSSAYGAGSFVFQPSAHHSSLRTRSRGCEGKLLSTFTVGRTDHHRSALFCTSRPKHWHSMEIRGHLVVNISYACSDRLNIDLSQIKVCMCYSIEFMS